MSNQPCATPSIVYGSTMNLATAQTCATLVNLAYEQFDQWVNQNYPSPDNFDWQVSLPGFAFSSALWGNAVMLDFSNPEPFGFVAFDTTGNSSAYVVFRGTMTTADEWNDADIEQVPYDLVTNPGFGNVHGGFYGVYTTAVTSGAQDALRDQTNAALATFNGQGPIKNVYFTGHSMGAALCTLSVPDVEHNSGLPLQSLALYNFASPRVGDTQLACSLNNPPQTSTVSSALFRIVNTEDAVPTLPLASGINFYEHVGTPVSFTAQYFSVDGNHSMLDCYTYAINNPGDPQGPVSVLPNVVTGSANGRRSVPAAAAIPAFPR